MTRANLRSVPKPTDEPPVDITLAMRADIEARDWGAMHVAADKRPAFKRLRWVVL
jgi:hypothetical protein